MKASNLILYLFIAISLSMFVSCGSDSSESVPTEKTIVGDWEMTDIVDSDGESLTVFDYFGYNQLFYSFDSDGKYIQTDESGNYYNGDWELDGSTITLDFEDFKIVSFSDEKITVQDFDDYKFTLERISSSSFPDEIISPYDADGIASVLILPSNSQVETGTAPTPSSDVNAPNVGDNQSGAEITAGSDLYLPFSFETLGSGTGYAGCYVQVNGASTYWDIPASSFNTTPSGQLVIPVGVPQNVANGSFCLSYCIYDNSGLVSNIIQTCIQISDPITCPASAGGSDGLTIKTVELGSTSGTVSVDYDMYSIPDRLDVFVNGTWVTGTSSIPLSRGQFPPTSQCYDGQEGYVSGAGTLSFFYNPSSGNTSVDLYISGCLGGGTAWDVFVSCPQ